MKTTQILIAGFGGQGVLFAGKFLAYKGLLEDRQVSWLPSYGPEMRGGTANCSVTISDAPIGSPIVTKPDCLIAMNLPSLLKYKDTVKAGGTIILDSALISEKVERDDVNVYYVPATKLAGEAGFPTLANMILTGKYLAAVDEVGMADIDDVLAKVVPPKKANLVEINKQALTIGHDYE
ncbi:MAG: 2-oxoacid:acceptor oxidoreductase family protein [Clostridia bacterium]|nr:2-oxoacid:acceptor oxidoreductase family protein [Clostridia bacterium]